MYLIATVMENKFVFFAHLACGGLHPRSPGWCLHLMTVLNNPEMRKLLNSGFRGGDVLSSTIELSGFRVDVFRSVNGVFVDAGWKRSGCKIFQILSVHFLRRFRLPVRIPDAS